MCMSIIKNVCLILLLPFCLMGQSKDVSKVGTTAATFLEIPAGAVAVGMGGAFVSQANDASALYWNVGGISTIGKYDLHLANMNWIGDTKYNFAGLVIPLGEFGTLGLSFTSLSMDDMAVRTVENPEGTGEFFSAGDMVKRDEEGFYYLVDRKSNMIISGGEHIFPSEVEKVITSHSSVLECAVVGLQDYKWGEAVTCICALKPGASPSDSLANEIREFCRGKLARFKVPKKVLFIDYDELPRTGSGKIIHRKLRERFNQ